MAYTRNSKRLPLIVLAGVVVVAAIILLVTLNPAKRPVGEGISPTQPAADYTSQVSAIYQYPELPTGCESVALTIVLRSMGFDLGMTAIADSYLQYSDFDFVNSFVGDPYSYDGMGVYAPGIADAAAAFLEDRGSDARARDLSKSSWDNLLAYVDKGYPVMVWTTSDQAEPVFTDDEVEGWHWYENEHCVVLYGYDSDAGLVSVSDPIGGIVEHGIAEFRDLYEACGSMAAAIA